MFKQIDYVMVTVSDMARSIGFYRDKMGLQLKSETPEWTEFQTGLTTLALHSGGKPKTPQKHGRPENYAGSCSIGFNVENLQKKYEELKSKGVWFVMPPRARDGEPIKLAVCIDPDGLPISIAESTTPA